jgi:hypothetical protein
MKAWIGKQLTNIVFLVLIVAAALTIYLLSRSNPIGDAPSGQTAAPSASPTASEEIFRRGVPEAVFRTHLQTSALYAADMAGADDREWTLLYGDSPTVTSHALYAVSDGCVSALEVSFDLPEVYEDEGDTAIDRYLYESSKQNPDAAAEAVRSLLGDLLPACDAEDRLSPITARNWAEQAVLLEKPGDDFKDTQDGCRFTALRTERSGTETLVCSLFFE